MSMVYVDYDKIRTITMRFAMFVRLVMFHRHTQATCISKKSNFANPAWFRMLSHGRWSVQAYSTHPIFMVFFYPSFLVSFRTIRLP